MKPIKRIDQILHLAPKPEIMPVPSLEMPTGSLLITCCGFEDRAREALRQVAQAKRSVRVLAVSYRPALKENQVREVGELLNCGHLEHEEIEYDREHPGEFARAFLPLVAAHAGAIYVDISGMSRLLIVQVLVLLAQSRRSFHDLHVIYCEAQEYPPSEEEAQQTLEKPSDDPLLGAMLLSSGVHEISIVPELSATNLMGLPIRLVAFPSFNRDQLSALRSEIQPTSFTLIHGVPLRGELLWRKEFLKQLNLTQGQPNSEDIDASTFDYRQTLNHLTTIYSQCLGRERMVVAPTGSKMQSLAVGVFRAYMNDVQIVYPTPHTFLFPDKYTHGVKQMYVLPLGNFPLFEKLSEEQ